MEQIADLLPERIKTNLTTAERKVLRCVLAGEVADLRSGEADKDDPKQWESWGPERTIRAELLLQLLCQHYPASEKVHPKGVRIRGARIEGEMDFEGASIINRLFMEDSAIPEAVLLTDANTRSIALAGSYLGRLSARNLKLEGDLFLARVTTAGEVNLQDADIRGVFACHGARLENPEGDALNADGVRVKGDVVLTEGFQAKGEVRLLGADIGGVLAFSGARLENPEGDVLSAENLTLTGPLFLTGASIRGGLDLMHAQVGPLVDDRASWPEPGKLTIDGFEYEALAGTQSPPRAEERLGWLRRRYPGPYNPQPYDQLAKVLRQMGRPGDATKVMVAKQNDLIRYGELNFGSRWWRRILGVTVGHGYRSWQALGWMLLFFAVGTGLFWWAQAYGYMRPVSEEVLVSPDYEATGRIPEDYPVFYPWLYSVDTLVPIVNLHQESFWQPKSETALGRTAYFYLRFHIAVGWILSTLFAAGVVGIVRRIE